MCGIRINQDFVSGLMFAGWGVAGLWIGRGYPIGSALRMGPGYVPRLLCWALIALGAIIAIKGAMVVGEKIERWHWRPLLVVSIAVLAFAFEHDAAVVDTNIARVYARVAGVRLTQRVVQTCADASLPAGDSWAWNQCLMDLGAQLCRPTSPRCGECPLTRWCVWRGRGDDPADGSAGVSKRQARFEGSDRQARGKLMRMLGDRAVPLHQLPDVMGCDAARAERLSAALAAEGLCVVERGWVRLP